MIYLILFHLLSVAGAYKYVQVSHSKGGEYGMLTPGLADLFVTIFPGVNTILSIIWLCGGATDKGYDLSKLFKVKK